MKSGSQPVAGIPLEGTFCVRVWEVARDLPLGFNYVNHLVFKQDFLFLRSFPLTCLIRQQKLFQDRKEPKR